jgi:hypothetical protein
MALRSRPLESCAHSGDAIADRLSLGSWRSRNAPLSCRRGSNYRSGGDTRNLTVTGLELCLLVQTVPTESIGSSGGPPPVTHGERKVLVILTKPALINGFPLIVEGSKSSKMTYPQCPQIKSSPPVPDIPLSVRRIDRFSVVAGPTGIMSIVAVSSPKLRQLRGHGFLEKYNPINPAHSEVKPHVYRCVNHFTH